MFVEVNTKIISGNSPHPNVKLASVEKKWMLDVLLDDPGPYLWISMKNAIVNITQVPEYLDASSLIQRCWLDKPHVLFAMLDGYSFFSGRATGYLFISVHE